ncbi:MAG: cyclic lactone autoinducer peptide [Peptococcaceae bacterium]
MKKVMFTALTSMLFLFATIGSAFACGGWAYQPKAPKSLQK